MQIEGRYSGRLLWYLGVGIVVLSVGCGSVSQEETALGMISAAVLNGDDDRVDWYQVADEPLRQSLAQRVAAVVWAHRVRIGSKSASVEAPTLRQSLGVCEEEPFSEQPSAALCTATLVDDDLVLTAGHCLGQSLKIAEDRCNRLAFVFGYRLARPEQVVPLTARDVYRCRKLVYHERSSTADGFRDVALIQLERSVPATPVEIADPAVGDDSVLASHGAGLPLKVEESASVLDVKAIDCSFRTDTDSYVGGSGAPLFNSRGQAVGFQVRGAGDWVTEGECLRSARVEEPSEQFHAMRWAAEVSCSAGWPSERWCARAPGCGDSYCTAGETVQSCPEDCPASVCGDEECASDERTECPRDCDDYAEVPLEWSDDPQLYRDALAAEGPTSGDSSNGDEGTQGQAGARLQPERAGCSLARVSETPWLGLLGLVSLTARRRERVQARARSR